jgi:hypothetical protein
VAVDRTQARKVNVLSDSPSRQSRHATGTPPTREEVEATVIAVFTEVLHDGDGVGRDTDFFDTGGTSLLAARAVARLRPVLPVRVSMRDIFSARTPATLSARIAERAAASSATS